MKVFEASLRLAHGLAHVQGRAVKIAHYSHLVIPAKAGTQRLAPKVQRRQLVPDEIDPATQAAGGRRNSIGISRSPANFSARPSAADHGTGCPS